MKTSEQRKIRMAIFNVISVQICFPTQERDGIDICGVDICDPKTCPIVKAIMEDLNGK